MRMPIRNVSAKFSESSTQKPACCLDCHFKYEDTHALPRLPSSIRKMLEREHEQLKQWGYPADAVEAHADRELKFYRRYCPERVCEQVEVDHQAYREKKLDFKETCENLKFDDTLRGCIRGGKLINSPKCQARFEALQASLKQLMAHPDAETFSLKLFSADEELALISEAKKGNVEARNHLLQVSIRISGSIAKRYGRPELYKELLSEGTIGVLKAIEKFNPAKNVRFVTYVSYWIKREMIRYLKDNLPLLPTEQLDQYPARESKDARIPLKHLHGILIQMPTREADIVRRRLGVAPYTSKQTLREIASQYKLSEGRVQQIEKVAMEKVQQSLREMNEGDPLNFAETKSINKAKQFLKRLKSEAVAVWTMLKEDFTPASPELKAKILKYNNDLKLAKEFFTSPEGSLYKKDFKDYTNWYDSVFSRFTYKDINRYLRHGVVFEPFKITKHYQQHREEMDPNHPRYSEDKKALKHKIERLKSAIQKAPKIQNTVHRAGKFPQAFVDQLLPGKIFTDPGFLSASIGQRAVAKYSGSKNIPGRVRVFMEIHGKQAVIISPVSRFKEDAEVIFQAGTRFKVLRRGQKNDIIFIEAEEV